MAHYKYMQQNSYKDAESDILAHPKVKLFITQGGMHSLIESVDHGKPIVGMPVFYDQDLNVEKAVSKGFGVALNFRNFTSAELRDAILEVLYNPKYAKRAREISTSFHHRPMKPLETAVYWTEYVLRYKGAPQMRVAARQLNFLQRYSVDTIAVLFGILLLLIIFITPGVYKLIARSKRTNRLHKFITANYITLGRIHGVRFGFLSMNALCLKFYKQIAKR